MVNLFKLLCVCEKLSDDDPIIIEREFEETSKYKRLNLLRKIGHWYTIIIGSIVGVCLIPFFIALVIGILIVSPGFFTWEYGNSKIEKTKAELFDKGE